MEGESTDGVPEITPVVVLKLRPVGSVALIEYDTTAPPTLDGVLFVIAWPFMYVAGFVEYASPEGATSSTVIDNVAVVEPMSFLAVTVWFVAADNALAVPEITPVVVLKFKPFGKAGLIEYELGAPPPLDGVLLVIAWLNV